MKSDSSGIPTLNRNFRKNLSPMGVNFTSTEIPLISLRMHAIGFATRNELTPAQAAFNKSMSLVRTSVEWALKDVKNTSRN